LRKGGNVQLPHQKKKRKKEKKRKNLSSSSLILSGLQDAVIYQINVNSFFDSERDGRGGGRKKGRKPDLG